MVFLDGHWYLDPDGEIRGGIVLDNLIHRGDIRVTIGVFVDPGVLDRAEQPKNRNVEYDAFDNRYATFLLTEIIPPGGRQCARPSTAAASSESEIMTARYARDLQRRRPTATRCALAGCRERTPPTGPTRRTPWPRRSHNGVLGRPAIDGDDGALEQSHGMEFGCGSCQDFPCEVGGEARHSFRDGGCAGTRARRTPFQVSQVLAARADQEAVATRRGQRLLEHLAQPAIRDLLGRYANANARPKCGPYKRSAQQ
jgi:hypothetical protein